MKDLDDEEISRLVFIFIFCVVVALVSVFGFSYDNIKHERKLEIERARAEHVLTFIREWRK